MANEINIALQDHMDITPTPRILRILGEIPFQPWQCLAELIDNSIDAFIKDEQESGESNEANIVINWSGNSVPIADFSIEISDTANGMTIQQLNNAVRAGYSSNDPVHNLGLFGMGFNIATARLGDKTTIVTTRSGDTEWIGVALDFNQMINDGQFNAPVVRIPKEDTSEHGTRIVVTELKEGIINTLRLKENDIRRQLENIYSPLLETRNIQINVRGKRLFPRPHCVWSSSRYVVRKGEKVPAIIYIDRDFGESYFDTGKNSYCDDDESKKYQFMVETGRELPENIICRRKRLTGWLGIQRYSDPDDFGIDFVRNGRKILIADKSFFQYENPLTGTKEIQYPKELGTTVGGRIVGELNVDYLLPTYQKNDFDRNDFSWIQTVEAICGVGPYLPKKRKAMGFDETVTAPLAVLVNAYARTDPGTKCLAVPTKIARDFALQFRQGKPQYSTDDPWWKVAQEEDQKRASGGGAVTTAVNTGDVATDDADAYFGSSSTEDTTETENNTSGVHDNPPTYNGKPVDEPTSVTTKENLNSTLDELLVHSNQVTELSGNYSYSSMPALRVKTYELKSGKIMRDGVRVPTFFYNAGIECTYIYDPHEPTLAQFPINSKMLLLQYLAEKFKARDGLKDIVAVYAQLLESAMPESRIDRNSLQEKAQEVFKRLREGIYDSLKDHYEEVLECIHESSGEVEDTVSSMFSNSALIVSFQNKEQEGYEAIEYVPERTLVRLVDRFPEYIFDDQVIHAPYTMINITDPKASERIRNESKDRIMSYLKDALSMVTHAGYGARDKKNELSRASISIDFLLEGIE